MASELTMPKLSDTMEQGTILRWYKHEGDQVAPGETLAEVETDKADMEIEATDSGTIREIRVKEGESAPVGAVIAVLNGREEAAHAQAPRADARREQPQAAAARRDEPPAGPPEQAIPPPARPQTLRAVPPQASTASQRPRPSPPAAPRREAPAPPQTSRRPEAVSKLRATVAKQMAASKREIPHFYVTSEIDMSEAARLRASISGSALVPERITFTHLLMRALAVTLPRHPRINASWSETGVVYHDDVNIGVAVAVEDGLIAPVIRSAQHLSLRAIARTADELISKAQAGHFSGDELTGATFTLSNMGMLDIEEFSAVITPPQAAILAVGTIKDRPVVRKGEIAVAKTMRVTLSVDHRVVNGVEAARFLEDLKTTLENPLVLVLSPE